MSLQVILDTIRASGETLVHEIELHAQSQAQKILEEANKEALHLKRETCAQVASQASKAGTRLIQQARLEAMQLVGSTREALVDAVLQEAREQIAGVRTSANYPVIFRALAEEAIDSLNPSLRDDEQPHLLVDPRDRDLLENKRDELGLDYPVSYRLDCLGGLLVSSEDDRVVVINTVESRFQRAIPYLRRYLNGIIEASETEPVPPPGVENVNRANVRL